MITTTYPDPTDAPAAILEQLATFDLDLARPVTVTAVGDTIVLVQQSSGPGA